VPPGVKGQSKSLGKGLCQIIKEQETEDSGVYKVAPVNAGPTVITCKDITPGPLRTGCGNLPELEKLGAIPPGYSEADDTIDNGADFVGF
jgi:hypothetical protein